MEVVWVASSLQPFIIILLLTVYLVYKRTSRVAFIGLNFLFTQVLNSAILKHIFAEPRPDGACSTSYGFPSGHSAQSTCWLIWLLFEWILFHDKVPFKSWKPHSFLRIFALVIVPFTPISRYYLNYHTIKQIMFGLLVGVICAGIIFYAMLVMIYKDEGKFWNSYVVFILKKIKGKDNMVIKKNINEVTSADQEGGTDQTSTDKDAYVVFPLKERFRKMLFGSSDNSQYVRVNSGESAGSYEE